MEIIAEKEYDPKISVIIPVYNIGAYLDICMESLERQTFKAFEVLLINDGSTDDSGERCRTWAENDGRIRELRRWDRVFSSGKIRTAGRWAAG